MIPSNITFAGETLPVELWAKRTGLPVDELRDRLGRGWSAAEALGVPAGAVRKADVRHRPCPAMKRHPLGLAYCAFKVKGRRRCVYFGPWGSRAAAAKYRRFTLSWPAPLAEQRTPGKWPARRLLTMEGTTATVAAWAKAFGLKPGTVRYRLDVLGWPVDRAIGTPVRALVRRADDTVPTPIPSSGRRSRDGAA